MRYVYRYGLPVAFGCVVYVVHPFTGSGHALRCCCYGSRCVTLFTVTAFAGRSLVTRYRLRWLHTVWLRCVPCARLLVAGLPLPLICPVTRFTVYVRFVTVTTVYHVVVVDLPRLFPLHTLLRGWVAVVVVDFTLRLIRYAFTLPFVTTRWRYLRYAVARVCVAVAGCLHVTITLLPRLPFGYLPHVPGFISHYHVLALRVTLRYTFTLRCCLIGYVTFTVVTVCRCRTRYGFCYHGCRFVYRFTFGCSALLRYRCSRSRYALRCYTFRLPDDAIAVTPRCSCLILPVVVTLPHYHVTLFDCCCSPIPLAGTIVAVDSFTLLLIVVVYRWVRCLIVVV